MPRLFTALELPRDVAAALAALRGGLPGARWIDPENYHLTLRFIGDIDAAMARDVHTALEGVRRAPVAVTLAGLAAFGGAKPRAIVMTARPDAALLALQSEHEVLMRHIGLAAETRKFTPHVTLARLRQTAPQLVGEYLSAHGLLPLRSFRAVRVALVSARKSSGGGPYIVEAVYPLR
ncbi:RNA 2',3'-cyclic phosphodiesterase [Beijerinckia sp. L45]|uniref:RNA 2',3'-cyclic phosphodiesterase n=1 Tax=Beijerinckia sp. L45 TaxID=1641855 RepID=UPI00131BC5FA|nr:RNA 2',3'-cyclic phosphodiesterase [Beijerinckia sp. L45]